MNRDRAKLVVTWRYHYTARKQLYYLFTVISFGKWVVLTHACSRPVPDAILPSLSFTQFYPIYHHSACPTQFPDRITAQSCLRRRLRLWLVHWMNFIQKALQKMNNSKVNSINPRSLEQKKVTWTLEVGNRTHPHAPLLLLTHVNSYYLALLHNAWFN